MPVSRDYLLFSILANVRNSEKDPIPYLSEPKGLPNDVTRIVEKDFISYLSDAHSESYLDVEELQRAKTIYREECKKHDIEFKHWAEQLDQVEEILNNVYFFHDARIVFWFDN